MRRPWYAGFAATGILAFWLFSGLAAALAAPAASTPQTTVQTSARTSESATTRPGKAEETEKTRETGNTGKAALPVTSATPSASETPTATASSAPEGSEVGAPAPEASGETSSFLGSASSFTAVKPASEPVFSWSGYFEAIGIMLLLLGGLWLLLWAIRKYGKLNFIPSGQGFPRDALRMEAQLPLGPKKGLVVVRFLNERLLLGVTEHHISVLSERLIRDTPADACEASHSESKEGNTGTSFAELLQNKTQKAADETDTTPAPKV